MNFDHVQSTGPLRMSPGEMKNVFEKRVVRDFDATGPPNRDPTFVMVGGAQGSGKSTTIWQAETELSGTTQKIIPDNGAAWVRGYDKLARVMPADAFKYAREAGAGSFGAALASRARKMKAHIILERAPPLDVAEDSAFYRRQGYRTELHVIATPRSQSLTGVFGRVEKALRDDGHIGTNVVVSRSTHDEAYAGWARVVFDTEQQKQFDRIVIKQRDGTVLHDNELIRRRDGRIAWKNAPVALEALLSSRHRAIGGSEAAEMNKTWKRIVKSRHMKSDPYLRSLPLKDYRDEMRYAVERPGSRVIVENDLVLPETVQ
ncbi:hypothetical protein QO002_000143 [Pararhizobium capsulatum DSM 1112]|uniref:Zeta toxin domain-containing protein n=1 Tax=Pararhizobium capsulatum DSM 1112 TaxID=1121113 RepID=A0ABU0BKM8_9HYPH|nr:zeta toxin family protein [Pararhizobium capsulatum]MDQ0318005.1 hypothetical protein [Pararhizobium capsulatum DSM 1112]